MKYVRSKGTPWFLGVQPTQLVCALALGQLRTQMHKICCTLSTGWLILVVKDHKRALYGQ